MQTKNLGIPSWFRLLWLSFFLSSSGFWILARVRPPREYFGLEYETIVTLLSATVLVVGVLACLFLFFHQRLPARAAYYLLTRGRWYAFWLTVYGLLEYYLRLPLFYIQQLELIFNKAALLGIRGTVPLVISVIIFVAFFVARPIENPFPPEWQRWLLEKKEKAFAKIFSVNSKWSAFIPGFLPVAMVLFVIYGLWGAKLSDYLPVFWNDATGYWLWIRQFSHYGLGGGYNFPNELTTPAAFNHFGEGSPLYIYFYGMFGYLFGWVPHLPILVNFALIIISVYAFSRLMHLDTAQNFVLALVMAVSWPVTMFAATTSHESLNQAIAVIFAGIFLHLRQARQVNPAAACFIALFAFFAGMLRLSWVILFLPLFYYLVPGGAIRKMLGSLLISGILTIGIVLLTQLLVPPINNSIFTALGNERGLLFGLQMQFIAQIKQLVSSQRFAPGIAIIFLLSMLIAYSARESRTLLMQKNRFDDLLKSQAFFDIYNALALLLAGMTLYLADGFYRVFFAPLLVSLFMRIAQKKYEFIWSMVLFSILFAPVMLTGQGNWQGTKMNYTYQFPGLDESRPVLEELLPYDETSDNPWCNTILILLNFYDARLTALPPSIGISYILFHPLTNLPIKSQFLLLDDGDYESLNRRYNLQAELLAELPIGRLYRNLDSNCTP